MKKMTILAAAVFVSVLLTACGGGQADATPTLSMDAIQTNAVATFAAAVTQTALAQPTATPTPSLTPSPVPTFEMPTVGTQPSGLQPTTAPLTACLRLAYVRDVTIPDGTVLPSGQAFEKKWLVANTGTCAWDPGFKLNFVGGEAMNGVALTLSQAVAPGAQVELTVPMVVPTGKTGTLRGNWRMMDAKGTYFGDEIYVEIVVGGTASTSTAGTPTATPSSTSSPVPTTP